MKFSNLRRYRQVLNVMIKYGFADFITHPSVKKIVPNFVKRQKVDGSLEKFTLKRYERIRLAIEELGPTFIKFGQILSNRPDLLPSELIVELEKLQDAVPSFGLEDLKNIIERELKSPVERLFLYFDEEPLASASISQVHRAKLHNGDDVVIKVQRPDISWIIDVDLEIMADFAEMAEKYWPALGRYEPVELVKSLYKSMHRELNFLLEANNMLRFKQMFEGDDTVYIPTVYPKLSSRRVLCMEFIDGIKISNVDELKKNNIDLHTIASNGLGIYFTQIFRHGYFHADPHPGNVIVRKDGSICLIDFGMVGNLTRKDKETFQDFIVSLTKGNYIKLVAAIEKLSKNKKITNREDLEYDVSVLLDEFPPETVGQRNINEIVDRLQYIIYKHKLSFPNDFFLLLRTLVILDGVSQTLDPDFNTLEYIRLQSLRLFEENLHPKKLVLNLFELLFSTWDYVKVLPKDFRKILDWLKEGKIKIEVTGLDPLLHALELVSNRLSAAIVLASLIIGSTFILKSNIPPFYNGIPIIGLIGISFSGLFGALLVISIFRKGKY